MGIVDRMCILYIKVYIKTTQTQNGGLVDDVEIVNVWKESEKLDERICNELNKVLPQPPQKFRFLSPETLMMLLSMARGIFQM